MGFSIKEVSEKLGIPPYTIRYYEKEGLLPDI
ncbi:MerR family DNA-binding transcriptional regulator [Paenibacillus sp. yr247]|nr:MerR family DNA-binding transcriptional regulator [Paenibacillus sp. yr247]